MKAYLEEVDILSTQCHNTNLSLNVTKTNEMIIDYGRKQMRNYSPLMINGATVEKVSNFKYPGVNFTEDLSWTTHTNSLVIKACQCLYHLKCLARVKVSHRMLTAFNAGAVESLLTGDIITWFRGAMAQNGKALSRVVGSVEKAIWTSLPCITDIYTQRCRTRARYTVKDFHHPGQGLFSVIPPGKCYRILRTNTERFRRIFYSRSIRRGHCIVSVYTVQLCIIAIFFYKY